MSVLKGQKLVENAKLEKLKCDILGDFQTLCWRQKTQTEYVKASKIELLPSVVYCVKLQDIFVCLM